MPVLKRCLSLQMRCPTLSLTRFLNWSLKHLLQQWQRLLLLLHPVLLQTMAKYSRLLRLQNKHLASGTPCSSQLQVQARLVVEMLGHHLAARVRRARRCPSGLRPRALLGDSKCGSRDRLREQFQAQLPPVALLWLLQLHRVHQ